MKEYLNRVNIECNMGWDDIFIGRVIKHIINKQGSYIEYGKDYKEIIDGIYGIKEDYSEIDFNDEIVEIEYIGEEELYDIEVSHDNLFYSNNILNHNSSMGNIDSGMEAVSESLKIAMTADVMVMLTTTDQMRDLNQQLWKLVKNRYTGQMVSLMMETCFERMMYSPYLGDYEPHKSQELTNTSKIEQPNKSDFDFGQINF